MEEWVNNIFYQAGMIHLFAYSLNPLQKTPHYAVLKMI